MHYGKVFNVKSKKKYCKIMFKTSA